MPIGLLDVTVDARTRNCNVDGITYTKPVRMAATFAGAVTKHATYTYLTDLGVGETNVLTVSDGIRLPMVAMGGDYGSQIVPPTGLWHVTLKVNRDGTGTSTTADSIYLYVMNSTFATTVNADYAPLQQMLPNETRSIHMVHYFENDQSLRIGCGPNAMGIASFHIDLTKIG